MQKIRTSEIARTRCCTDQTLCGLKNVAEGWKFPSCQSQKDRVHPNSALLGAPEVLCDTIEFRGGVEAELTQKDHSTPPPGASCPKVQSRSPARSDLLIKVSLVLERKNMDVDVAYLSLRAVCIVFMK